MKSRSILRFSRGVLRFFAAAVICSVFYTVFTFLTPQIIRVTVDNIIGSDVPENRLVLWLLDVLGGRETLRSNLIFCALGIALCSLVAGVFNFFSRICITSGTERFIKKLRDALMRHIEFLPFSWHSENVTGDIIQRCTADVDTMRIFISSQLIEVIRTLILIATALVMMFSMNAALAWVFFITVPVIVLYSLLFHKRISRQFRQADEREGELLIDVQENLTGVRVVRAFGREKHELEKFSKKSDAFAKCWVDLGYTLGIFWGIGDLATCLQLMSVICVGVFLAARGHLSLGTFLAFISYTQTLSGPVRQLGKSLSEFSKASVSADRISEILDAPAETEPEGALREGFGGDIAFENVSFSYGDAQVLHDLSFTVPAGSTLGILGATGSGKSTVTYLLNRLYEPTEGRITVGGRDLRDFDRRYLRSNIGVVLQEPFLFSKTIAENLTLRSDGLNEAEMRRCASIAAVDRDIESFSAGYDTLVGERGVTLSGGQKQRIAIARALMLHCPVMVFDDSMSALDMETDARIREALRENTAGATVILISHRISTLMQADKIIVLEDGRITGSGTHAQLAAAGGMYSRVCAIQSGKTGEKGGEANG